MKISKPCEALYGGRLRGRGWNFQMVTVNLTDFVSDHSKTHLSNMEECEGRGPKVSSETVYCLNQHLRMLSDVRNRSPTQTGLNKKDVYSIMWEWTLTEWKSRGVQIQAWLDQVFYFIFMWLSQVCIPLLTISPCHTPGSLSGIFGWLQLATKTTLFSCSQRTKEVTRVGPSISHKRK